MGCMCPIHCNFLSHIWCSSFSALNTGNEPRTWWWCGTLVGAGSKSGHHGHHYHGSCRRALRGLRSRTMTWWRNAIEAPSPLLVRGTKRGHQWIPRVSLLLSESVRMYRPLDTLFYLRYTPRLGIQMSNILLLGITFSFGATLFGWNLWNFDI